MDNWILIVGYDRPHFDMAQKEWVKYNVFLHLAVNALDTIEKVFDPAVSCCNRIL